MSFMKELFSKSQIKEAISKLSSSLPDKDVSNGILFQPFCNTTITHDFTRKSLKRVNVANSSFVKSKFNGVAATGSKFSDTYFKNCNFSGANFQYCYFNNSQFSGSSMIRGANFSHSVFIGCTFTNITIVESTLYDCYFENCKFAKSNIRTNTLENSTMHNCSINNIDLAHINLEYMKFDQVIMDNVILPPYQIPYIIGAPSYIKNTDEKIYVYTDCGNITTAEYANMYDDISAYFFDKKLYFPLANILIANERHSDAFEFIQSGIEEACDYFDFRMIKHYCRLACSNNNFTHTQLKVLYDRVTDLSYNNAWDINTLHSYMLNIGEIKEILLNNSENKQRVEFIIKTDIDKDDLASINILYNEINIVIKSICSNTHVDSIELRHNSPYELYITCIDAMPNILMFVATMYSVFIAGNKGIEIFKNIEETVHLHHQNELHQYDIEAKKLDIELKKEELRHIKNNNNIAAPSVTELEHILKCNSIEIARNITPEYLHYKISNIPEVI